MVLILFTKTPEKFNFSFQVKLFKDSAVGWCLSGRDPELFWKLLRTQGQCLYNLASYHALLNVSCINLSLSMIWVIEYK